jgi:hypothetical protein
MAATYTQAQLQTMLAAGTAYRLPDGRIVPLLDHQDLNAAPGVGADDPGLREAIGRRAKALATAGKSRLTQLESIEVERFDGVAHAANGYGVLLAKGVRMLDDASAQLRRQLGDGGTASAALAKAAHCDQMAAQIADPAAADGYRQLAGQARAEAEAGAPGEAVVKAWKLEDQAASVSDPAMAENYRQLARETRKKAGLA